MASANDTIRVVIPLSIRRRNGRPKILPPEDVLEQQARVQNPHILKALGRAWAWRRRLESGEVATAGDLAKLEGVTERFVSRTMRLALLSPDVLEYLLIFFDPPCVPVNELVEISSLPWTGQTGRVFCVPDGPPDAEFPAGRAARSAITTATGNTPLPEDRYP